MKTFAQAAAFLLAFLTAQNAFAELQLSLHGGLAHTYNSDIQITQTNRLSLTLHDVDWKNENFQEPPYWGVRIIYWKDWMPDSGFGLDFVHAKIVASDNQVVYASGDRGGNTPVHGFETLGSTISGLAFSHGLNFLMLNIYERWRAKESFRPFAGAGVGILLPHVEGRIGSEQGDSYHYGGWALQGLGGFEITLGGPVSLFAEYKIHHSWLKVPYGATASLSTKLWTHQIALGLSAAIPTNWSQP